MPQQWWSFLATDLNSLWIWLNLLSSMQQFHSIRSGSAAVSLLNVSKSTMKSNSAVLTLSSCCLFLVAFCSSTRFIRTYWTGYVLSGTIAVVLDGYGEVCSWLMCCHGFVLVWWGGVFSVSWCFISSVRLILALWPWWYLVAEISEVASNDACFSFFSFQLQVYSLYLSSLVFFWPSWDVTVSAKASVPLWLHYSWFCQFNPYVF